MGMCAIWRLQTNAHPLLYNALVCRGNS